MNYWFPLYVRFHNSTVWKDPNNFHLPSTEAITARAVPNQPGHPSFWESTLTDPTFPHLDVTAIILWVFYMLSFVGYLKLLWVSRLQNFSVLLCRQKWVPKTNSMGLRPSPEAALSPLHGASSGCGWKEVAANMLNKQSRTAWGLGVGLTTPQRKKLASFKTCKNGLLRRKKKTMFCSRV